MLDEDGHSIFAAHLRRMSDRIAARKAAGETIAAIRRKPARRSTETFEQREYGTLNKQMQGIK